MILKISHAQSPQTQTGTASNHLDLFHEIFLEKHGQDEVEPRIKQVVTRIEVKAVTGFDLGHFQEFQHSSRYSTQIRTQRATTSATLNLRR